MLQEFIAKERAFLEDIPPDQRGLLFGSFFYALAAPVLTIFSNTYLWRQTPDPIVLALYNIGFYAGLPFGFFLNGHLLKHIASARLYFLGCFLQGLITVLLVLLGARASDLALELGLALGVSAGFYWGNRNYLTSRHSMGPKRFKYLSIEMTTVTFAGIFSPIFTGWFLTLGERTGWYTTQTAYEIVTSLGLLLFLASGTCVMRAIHDKDLLSHLRIRKATPIWNRLRCLEFIDGAINGLEIILPVVILLLFVGQEDSIGLVKSYAAILAAISLYTIGRRVQHHHHVTVLRFWTLVTAFGQICFSLLNSLTGALLLFTGNGLVSSWRWTSLSAVLYETIDKETEGDDGGLRYAYVTDREALLNLGRVSTLLLFMIFYQFLPESTIRYGLLLTIPLQLVLIFLVKRQLKILKTTPPFSSSIL